MKMKYIFKFVLTFLILLASEIAILTIVNIIPQKNIESNVKKSSAIFNEDGLFPTLGNDNTFILDNWTDAVMINTAYSVDYEKPLESAMLMRRNYRKNADIILQRQDEEKNPILSLSETLEGKNKIYYEYSRYWHGYMIYLRPLLVFLNYSQIRVLFTIIICGLSILLTYVTYKKIDIISSIMIAILLLISRFYFIGMSLQYSATFVIMLIASLYIILKYNRIDKYRCFFVIGCVTCFFDLLTSPLITIGVPLIYYIKLKQKNNEIISTKEIIKIIVLWFLGYGLMWVSKWVICDLMFNVGTIKRAIQKISLLTTNVDEINVSFVQSIIANIGALNHSVVIGLIMMLITIMSIVSCNYNSKNFKEKIPYIIIILLPFVWYALIKNHSYIHARFTYRNLLVSIFGLIVLLEQNIREYMKFNKNKIISK